MNIQYIQLRRKYRAMGGEKQWEKDGFHPDLIDLRMQLEAMEIKLSSTEIIESIRMMFNKPQAKPSTDIS